MIPDISLCLVCLMTKAILSLYTGFFNFSGEPSPSPDMIGDLLGPGFPCGSSSKHQKLKVLNKFHSLISQSSRA